jgi:hypothetical protein
VTRVQHFTIPSLTLALAVFSFTCLLTAQTRKGGSGPGNSEVTVGADVHHDVSRPLRDTRPEPAYLHSAPHEVRSGLEIPRGTKGLPSDAASGVRPDLVNGSTGAQTTLGIFNLAGVGNYFTGPDRGFTPAATPSDATGTWNRYSFTIGTVNTTWENENAKLGVWSDGYYMGFDMYAGNTFLGPALEDDFRTFLWEAVAA